MARPDLKTREGRAAYQAELGGVARGWRWIGLGLVLLGAGGLFLTRGLGLHYTDSAIGLATIALLVVGWGLCIVGVIRRTAYHRRRMAGLEQGTAPLSPR